MKEATRDEISARARERQIPLNATFELTYRCNLSCVHCYVEEDTDGELTTAEVFSSIDQLADAGTLVMVFTGGEPLVRDDFFDIAEYARKRNMALSLMSNGTLIDERAVEKMKRLHFLRVSISLYGVTPKTHDAVTQVAGSFFRTFKAIRLLKENGFRLDIKTPVMKQNMDEIAQIGDFCQELGAETNADPNITITTKGSRRPLEYRLSDEELSTHVLWEAQSGKEVQGFTRVCNAGFCNVAIGAQGKVFPCNALRLEAGDLRQDSFAQIWSRSPVFHRLRQLKMEDFRECSSCELLYNCARCPGRAFHEEGDMLLPPKEACRISRMRQEARIGQEN